MIDPHVHLRDWRQADKETLAHAFSVAWRAGLDAVFEMPNTDPPLTTRDAILKRIDDADAARARVGTRIFHGLYAGLTTDPRQIEEAVGAWRGLFPRVVGLKLFAGHSTGNIGIVELDAQRALFARLSSLGFTGVLAVHCEKERLMRPHLWDPARPETHATARPPEAEVQSVKDQIQAARDAEFRGVLHITHISTPEALREVRLARAAGDRITCGLTPHHALLCAGDLVGDGGLLRKTNPPLRPSPMPQEMLEALCVGDIDWIETDHAPHTLADKTERHAAGVPGLPFLPRFLRVLRDRGLPPERLAALTHGNICRVFGLEIADTRRESEPGLEREYPFDAFQGV